ncbi:MAG: cytochrome c maturation protein CcmE [Archaeoglobales archaeon]|nr:cytochrome c maturation protein CcmE [Archaeoglobales archaeon]
MPRIALILLIAFAGFAIFTLYHSVSSSLTPSDLLTMGNAENVVVSGRVENISYANGLVYFYITDGKAKLRAVYEGKIAGEEVIATGDWKDGTFYVKEVLSKCHTEYKGG